MANPFDILPLNLFNLFITHGDVSLQRHYMAILLRIYALAEFDPKVPVRSAEQWLFVFDKVGEWKFHDHLYPEFQGTIEVVEVGELPMAPSVFNLEIREKKFTSTLSTLHVYQGDNVVINVLSDEQDELYLHGYDKSVALEAGKESTLTFTADVPGKFTFELLRSGVEIGSLIVEPK